MKKLDKAKTGMVLNHPFFATLMLKMEFRENTEIETLSTDGNTIQYNPEYIDKLSPQELQSVLAHECMHVGLCHHIRRGGRDPKLWNESTDYVINNILIDAGLELPDFAFINPEFSDKTAEQVYTILYEQRDKENNGDNSPGDGSGQSPPGNNQGDPGNGGGGTPNDPGGMGQVTDYSGDSKQEEQNQKMNMQQALEASKAQGKTPGEMDRIVGEIISERIPWREMLIRFLTEYDRNDYSWQRPNARYVASGLYLPYLQSAGKGKICLMADTSGSQSDVAIQEIGGEIHSMLDQINADLTVLYVDSEVAGVQEFTKYDTPDFKPKGGGGTSFIPGFEWIDESGEEYNAVVYFTDGHCDRFYSNPEVPVIWVLDNDKVNFEPPYGEVAYYE